MPAPRPDGPSSDAIERPAPRARSRFGRALDRAAARPAIVCALAALAVRLVVVLDAWASNPFVRSKQLDGAFYLAWAADIADGDLLGRGGVIRGEPFLFNPLYAYVLAPLAHLLRDGHLPVLLLHAVLAAGTTGLTAAAARRFLGRGAAWTAGVLVAFSSVLAHLDAHVAVSELAAFLVAGACFACAPARSGDAPWAHGPAAGGLWLGVAALARPITPIALPFVAWLHARRAPPGRKLRAALVTAAAFAATAAPTFVRNWTVADEPALWTAAGGINFHLGNNYEARRFRSMGTKAFRFSPTQMHDDARAYIQRTTGRRLSRGDVGRWFRDAALREIANAPWDSAVHYLRKVGWFFGPVEVPSSASLAMDRSFQPWLVIAFVPTWLVAALALAGAWLGRRNDGLLLGPGAIAGAHVVVLVMVFPLSHYRSPAIPALAVLASAAVVSGAAALRGGRPRDVAGGAAALAFALAIGWLPARPDTMRARDAAVLAMLHRDRGEYDLAEASAREAIRIYREEWPGATEPSLYWSALAEFQMRGGKWDDALASLDRAHTIDPNDAFAWIQRSLVLERRGDLVASEAAARRALALSPDEPPVWGRLGEVLSRFPARSAEAADLLAAAVRAGAPVDPEALRRLGLR